MEEELKATIKTLSTLIRSRNGTLKKGLYKNDELNTLNIWNDLNCLRQLNWYINSIVVDDMELGLKYVAEISELNRRLSELLKDNKYESKPLNESL